jgi:hypothetical protein
MEKDNIWIFYSLEVMMQYWASTHPTQFNLDKHEKDFRKKSRHTKKGKQNLQRQKGTERQQVLPFGE